MTAEHMGMSGYMVWSDVRGNQVTATEIWESDWTKEIDSPLVAESTYTLRDGKIAEWMWTVSPESSWRVMNTPSSLEANRQLMTSIYEEIWNQGNLDLIDERYADDYVRHQAGYPTELAGSEGLKQFIQALRAGFPDFHCTIEEMLAAGDKVVDPLMCARARKPANGTASRPLATRSHLPPPSSIRSRMARSWRIWADYDSLGWMLQLGFELAPAQPPATSGYLPPEILVTGAYIHSPNGIKAGPDGNLYVASINERAILVIDPETGEILKRLGARGRRGWTG